MSIQKQSSVRGTTARDNRLVGWLVSYALDDKGVSYELRSGRYLVSSEDTSDSHTITVSEETVSSPHLAMNASPRHSLMVQDIFSDHGTFIVKSGSNDEVAVNGPTELKHGDWIRIGASTRFQVCLIDVVSK